MWAWIKKILGIKPKAVVVEKTAVIELDKMKEPPSLLDWILGEVGISETSNPDRVVFYLSNTKLDKQYWKPSTSWCAAFLSTALLQTGHKSLKTAWARDYQNYGPKLTKPVKGCIMGFERNEPGGDSHVAVWTGEETATHYLVAGGNQSNKVCVQRYAKKDLIYMVMPEKQNG